MRIRAASLLLLFLSGWLAMPVRFAMPEPPSCTMECCLTQGYCSCKMSKTASARGEGHDHPEGEEASGEEGMRPDEMAAVTINAPCPQRCAQVPSGLRNVSAHKAAALEYSITLSLRRLLQSRTPRFARDALLAEAHSPRAPPHALL
ncbi:MAG: hypothetical protein ACREEM_11690 [Blastocatellia bacterium]